MNDPATQISAVLREQPVQVLKPEFGTIGSGVYSLPRPMLSAAKPLVCASKNVLGGFTRDLRLSTGSGLIRAEGIACQRIAGVCESTRP